MSTSLVVAILPLTLLLGLPLAAQELPVVDVTSGTIYSRAVTPQLTKAWRHIPIEIFLNGMAWQHGTTIKEDGHYVLEFRASDLLGRPLALPPVSFTIDTIPPEIVFGRPPGLPVGALPRVRVRDENPDPEALALFLDGKPYRRSDPIDPGEHLLEAITTDRAGNVGRESQVVSTGACEPTSFVDYVPPVTTLSAAHYFPWHSASPECPASSYWCNCIWGPKPGNPRPARGFYDSGSQTVVNAQLDQMIAHGVDLIAVEWFGEPTITSNFLNRVLPALSVRNLQFALLYDMGLRLIPSGFTIDFNNPTNRSIFINDFTSFASSSSYFKHSKQLKFKNKPAVYLYVTRAITGTDANIQAAFDAIHNAAVNNGFAGLYLVADHLSFGIIDYNRLRLMRPSAVTAFAPVSTNQGVPQGSSSRPVRTWADKLANLYQNSLGSLPAVGTVDLTPGVFVQYDDSGLNTSACGGRAEVQNYRLLDGSDWSYMLQTAGINQRWIAERTTIRPLCTETVTTNTDYTSIVWTYSYNEWAEGSGFEELTPRTSSYPFGFGLQPLQLLKQKLP